MSGDHVPLCFLGSEAGDGAPTEGGVGAWEERGTGQEERGGAGRDIPTQGQKEESRAGAGGCGETALTVKQMCTYKQESMGTH